MTTLPAHPYTGLTAIGVRRDGRPIWPIKGGDGTTPPPADPPTPDPTPAVAPTPGPPPAAPAPAPTQQPAGDPPAATLSPTPDDQLGDGGKKALTAEREARKAAEDARKTLEKQLADLAPLTDLIGQIRKAAVPDTEKTDAEKLREELNALRLVADTDRVERFRIEVATDKGLTKEQAGRLVGTTREELAADADALLTLFPKAAAPPPPPPVDPQPEPAKPKNTPKPDPSQGSRGQQPTRAGSLHAAVTNALTTSG